MWDVQIFFDKLLENTGVQVRLPTQVEFVHACAKVDDRDIALPGWVRPESGGKLHRAATSEPNENGIYDAVGNVAEWAQPDGPLKTGYVYSIVLGTHYNSRHWENACSTMMERYSFNRTPIIGFRLVLDD